MSEIEIELTREEQKQILEQRKRDARNAKAKAKRDAKRAEEQAHYREWMETTQALNAARKTRPQPQPIDFEEHTRRVNAENAVRTKMAEEQAQERRIVLDLIDHGFRSLAKSLHPDAGGSGADMARLSAVRDKLKRAQRW